MPLTDKQQRDLLLLQDYSLWTVFATPKHKIAQRFLRLENIDCDVSQVFAFLIGEQRIGNINIFLYDIFEFLKLQTKKEDDYLSIMYVNYLELVEDWQVINDGKLTDDEQKVLEDLLVKKFSHTTN